MNNLQACLQFYKDYGAPVIHDRFGEYEERIAVGLVGFGSDCFGFEDAISMDHDYGLGFCLWLTDADYDRIGAPLAQAYAELTDAFSDGQPDILSKPAAQDGSMQSRKLFFDARRGVFRIGDFYKCLLDADVLTSGEGADKNHPYVLPWTDRQWLAVAEDKLATAVNGQVYRDDLGLFSAIRSALKAYYPERVRRQRLGVELYHFSQNVQSNYARMMARGDYVTANLCVQQGVKSAMAIVYLLNKTYAPYYKWMRRGMHTLPVLPEIGQILDAMAQVGCQEQAWRGRDYNPYEVNLSDPLVKAFETIAAMLLEEMNRQGIVCGENPFLDIYSRQLLADCD